MPKLSLRHCTTYSYWTPVQLSPHRLMLRPRESPDLVLLNYEIQLSPAARVAWTMDLFGNAVATATFSEPTCQLEIISKADVDLTSESWPVSDISASAINYPFKYHENDWRDLGSLRDGQHDPTFDVQRCVKGFVMGNTTDTLSLLKDLSVFRRGIRPHHRRLRLTPSA